MFAGFAQKMTAEFGRPWLKVWNFTDRCFKLFQWLAFLSAVTFAADKTGSSALALLGLLLFLPLAVLVFMPLFIAVSKAGKSTDGLAASLIGLVYLAAAMAGMFVAVWIWIELLSVFNGLTAAARPGVCK